MHSAFSGVQQQLPGRQCVHRAVICRQLPYRLLQRDALVANDRLRCRATLTKPNKQSAQHTSVHVAQRKASAENFTKSAQAPVTFESLKLHTYNTDSTAKLDLVVAGGGPSGIAVAERVSAAGYKVCVVDPAPLAHWPNNYGVWVDEFEAMGLQDCLEIIWPKAKVHLDSGTEHERCDSLGQSFYRGHPDSLYFESLVTVHSRLGVAQVSVQTIRPCGQDKAQDQASAALC